MSLHFQTVPDFEPDLPCPVAPPHPAQYIPPVSPGASSTGGASPIAAVRRSLSIDQSSPLVCDSADDFSLVQAVETVGPVSGYSPTDSRSFRLYFHRGDFIHVISRCNAFWWYGELEVRVDESETDDEDIGRDARGYFPTSLVRVPGHRATLREELESLQLPPQHRLQLLVRQARWCFATCLKYLQQKVKKNSITKLLWGPFKRQIRKPGEEHLVEILDRQIVTQRFVFVCFFCGLFCGCRNKKRPSHFLFRILSFRCHLFIDCCFSSQSLCCCCCATLFPQKKKKANVKLPSASKSITSKMNSNVKPKPFHSLVVTLTIFPMTKNLKCGNVASHASSISRTSLQT
jgi:hypothetical protein